MLGLAKTILAVAGLDVGKLGLERRNEDDVQEDEAGFICLRQSGGEIKCPAGLFAVVHRDEDLAENLRRLLDGVACMSDRCEAGVLVLDDPPVGAVQDTL